MAGSDFRRDCIRRSNSDPCGETGSLWQHRGQHKAKERRHTQEMGKKKKIMSRRNNPRAECIYGNLCDNVNVRTWEPTEILRRSVSVKDGRL